jgi:hypothetical protein
MISTELRVALPGTSAGSAGTVLGGVAIYCASITRANIVSAMQRLAFLSSFSFIRILSQSRLILLVRRTTPPHFADIRILLVYTHALQRSLVSRFR